ncbi:centromere protein N-like [Diadema antillarum]|uniref:centromere protein N-like n=1 Tax=Diadema antillarum TaxID=105358 RepID=UPI003A8579CD
MVSSDLKGVLSRVLGCIKREELGSILQEWAVLDEDRTRAIIGLLDRGNRAVPRRTIVQKVVEECLRQQISKKQISQLDLLCNITHPERKKWSVYKLMMSDSETQQKAFDTKVYFSKVTTCMSAYFKHDLCMDQRDDAIWLRIGVCEGMRDTPSSFFSNSVFVVYHPGSDYIIMSRARKGLLDFIMQALIQALGCTGTKESKLSGYHLDSLSDLSLHQASQGWFSKFSLNQVDPNPLVKTQSRKRRGDSLDLEEKSLIAENDAELRKYEMELEESCGPNKLPKLEKICYEMETKFRGTHAAPDMMLREEPFHCTVKFEGPNVLDGLKQLRPLGAASATFPHLFEQVLKMGKNHFKIYDKSHQAGKSSQKEMV